MAACCGRKNKKLVLLGKVINHTVTDATTSKGTANGEGNGNEKGNNGQGMWEIKVGERLLLIPLCIYFS